MKNRIVLGGCLILAACATVTNGQTVPLHFGTTNGVSDEFGHILRGTDVGATLFGFPYVTGEVVQLLGANSGVFPPNVDGTPNTNNPVLFETRVGTGADPSLGPAGLFGGSMQRPSGQIIARVFNRSSLAAASFYADSQVFVVPTTNYDVFIVRLARTESPLDSADNDADGLHNSWEKSLGSNANNPDSDGDGMADGAEFRAGTDVMNSSSFLAMVQLIPSGNGDLGVIWDSVVGKQYVIEYTADDLRNNPAYTNVTGMLSATGSMTSATIINGMLNEGGHYRVRLAD
ncbi:MAG: thrombospondin type 3 repeat-containing protein [bacterium]